MGMIDKEMGHKCVIQLWCNTFHLIEQILAGKFR